MVPRGAPCGSPPRHPTPSPEGYAGAGVALLAACMVGIVRAGVLHRESRQLAEQDAWSIPGAVQTMLTVLPITVAIAGIGGAIVALIGAWI